MLPDYLPVLCAFCVFAGLLVAPGYVLGHVTNLLKFRQQDLIVRLSAALVFSIACCPALFFQAVRWGGFPAAWLVLGAFWAVFAAILLRTRVGPASVARALRTHWKLWCGMALWVLLGALLLTDVVYQGNVYRSATTMDSVAHVAVIDAITRTGAPPAAAGFYPGHHVPLLYYYFWYLLGSLTDQLTGHWAGARAVEEAGKLWIGLALGALAYLYLRLQSHRLFPPGLRPSRAGIGVALFLCTGLDLIPNAFLAAMHMLFHVAGGLGASLEHWNEQVTAWLGAAFMSPHHPAAAVACFTGVLLIMEAMETSPGWRRRAAIGLAGVAFASAGGMSVWVTLTAGVGFALWFVYMAARRAAPVRMLAAAAAIAAVLIAPFLLGLPSGFQFDEPVVTLGIRNFAPVDRWMSGRFVGLSPDAQVVLRFVLLPVNYLFELGFFMIAGLVYWRWRIRRGTPPERHEALLVSLVLGSLLVCTFVRASIAYNDLGWRGFLIAQFGLLLWSVPVVESRMRRRGSGAGRILPWILGASLAIGVLGTVAEMCWLRVSFPYWRGRVESAALREGYTWIDRHTPRDAVLAYNNARPEPQPNANLDRISAWLAGGITDYASYYSGHRQQALGGRVLWHYGTNGIGEETMAEMERKVMQLFDGSLDVAGVRRRCGELGITVLVVKHTDPVWRDPQSWVWRIPAAFANRDMRVYLEAPGR